MQFQFTNVRDKRANHMIFPITERSFNPAPQRSNPTLSRGELQRIVADMIG